MGELHWNQSPYEAAGLFCPNRHDFKHSIKQFLNQSIEDWNSKDKSSSRVAGKTMEFKQEF